VSRSAKPAWSEAFDRDRLGEIRPLRLPSPITREWAWGDASGAGVRVAVVDSGVDAGHPRVGGLDGGIVVEPDGDDVRIVEGLHEDLFGHGTACAAIIRGLAPQCRLYSVRVLGATLKGRGSVFATGLRWAIEQRMEVVNLSMSSRSADLRVVFHELADLAAFRNVMLVSAINNSPAPSYPSEFASVFSVAAYEGRDPEHFVVNPAPPVEYGAPGIDVEVPWASGSIVATGNSFAAPHIAGLVVRILARHPGITPAEVKTVLRALADNAR
jgi:subtilisin